MNKNKNTYLVALGFVGLLFFVIGFALGINGILIPFLKSGLSLTSAEAYMLITATFVPFVLFGYPSGMLIKRIGYKKSMSVSFLLFAVGLILFVPSAVYQSMPLFLLGSFVSGMGNTLLQAAVNPYVTIIGPEESGATRMSVMGILNKAGWAVAPVFLALFLNLADVNLKSLYFPFYLITGIFIVLGILSFFSPLPEVKAEGEDDAADAAGVLDKGSITGDKTSIWQFPHLIMGAVALFLYVGVETLALVSVVDFAGTIGLESPEKYTSYTVAAMVAGYLFGALCIPKVISQYRALQVCAWLGVACSVAAPLVPYQYAIFFVAAFGLANSLIWPAVWPLAMKGLGRFTKTGSSILVMAIAGGAVIPLLFGMAKDFFGGNIQQAYWVCVPCYLFILYYALYGYKIKNKSPITV